MSTNQQPPASPSLDVEKMAREISLKVADKLLACGLAYEYPTEYTAQTIEPLILSSLQPLIDRQAEAVRVIEEMAASLCDCMPPQGSYGVANRKRIALNNAANFLTQPSNPKT